MFYFNINNQSGTYGFSKTTIQTWLKLYLLPPENISVLQFLLRNQIGSMATDLIISTIANSAGLAFDQCSSKLHHFNKLNDNLISVAVLTPGYTCHSLFSVPKFWTKIWLYLDVGSICTGPRHSCPKWTRDAGGSRVPRGGGVGCWQLSPSLWCIEWRHPPPCRWWTERALVGGKIVLIIYWDSDKIIGDFLTKIKLQIHDRSCFHDARQEQGDRIVQQMSYVQWECHISMVM